LRWQLCRKRRELLQVRHIGSGQKLPFIGPSLGPAGGSDAKKCPVSLQYFKPLAVRDAGHWSGLRGNVAANLEDRRPYKRFADSGCALRSALAAGNQTRGNQEHQRYRRANLSYGSKTGTLYQFTSRTIAIGIKMKVDVQEAHAFRWRHRIVIRRLSGVTGADLAWRARIHRLPNRRNLRHGNIVSGGVRAFRQGLLDAETLRSRRTCAVGAGSERPRC